jgi:hypothetical protein
LDALALGEYSITMAKWISISVSPEVLLNLSLKHAHYFQIYAVVAWDRIWPTPNKVIHQKDFCGTHQL